MPHEETDIEVPPSWLIVATARNGEIVYEAGWRHREAGRLADDDEAAPRLGLA